jgi:hypothetical protein
MSMISSITSYVGKPTGAIVNRCTKWSFIAKTLEKGVKEPARCAGLMMVISIVSKDLVGCALYTYQSLTNKRIPEEKRKFVAALDFIQGIVNVGGQIASFMLVDKLLIPRLFCKHYTGVFTDKHGKKEVDIYKNTTSPLSKDNLVKLTADVIKERAEELKKLNVNPDDAIRNITEVSESVIKKFGHGSGVAKDLSTGLGIIVTSLATMALIKRTLAPLIATPLAGKISEIGDDKKKKAPALTPAEVDSTMPEHKNEAGKSRKVS